MAGKDLTYRIGIDASDATGSLQKFGAAVKGTMAQVESELDESATAGEKLSTSLDKLSAQMREDFNSAAIAAEEMGRALKDAGSNLNVADVVPQLQRMGLSFDEITQEADKLAGSLKQLDDVKATGVKDLDGIAPGLASKLDGVARSAGSSQSVLANMVGNSVQDLGALAGVSGSAGVAIGQMGEYMRDARADGDSLGDIFKNFGNVAGPIAALAFGMELVSSATEVMKEEAAAAKERTADLGEAMANSTDDALGFANVLREDADSLSEFNAASTEAFGEWGVRADALLNKLPLIGRAFGDSGENVLDVARRAGVGMYTLGQQIDGTGESADAFNARLQEAVNLGRITEGEMKALAEATAVYGDSAMQAAKDSGMFNVSTEEANAIIRDSVDPLKQYGAQWAILKEDMADGTINFDSTTAAVNFLAESLGLTREEVIALAQEELDKQLQDDANAAKELAAAQEEAARAAREHAIAVTDASTSLDELGDSLGDIRADAISGVFEEFGKPEADAGRIRDIAVAVSELPDAFKELEGVSVGDIMAGSFKADAFLDQMDGLGEQMRERMQDAFAAGDPQGAKDIAETTIRQVVDAMGGKLTGAQVSTLLGLDDLEAQVDVALELSSVEAAKRQLAVLTGVTGQTPYTASIALALEAGTITGAQAQLLIQAKLGDASVPVPSNLVPPDNTPEALAAAQAALAGSPATVSTTLDPTGATTGMAEVTDRVYEAEVIADADTTPAEDAIASTEDVAARTNPVVDVSSEVREATAAIIYLRIIAALLSPKVTVTADVFPAIIRAAAAVSTINGYTARVPVDAYLRSVPSAGEIASRIGVVRVPVDAYVRTTPRVTGLYPE